MIRLSGTVAAKTRQYSLKPASDAANILEKYTFRLK